MPKHRTEIRDVGYHEAMDDRVDPGLNAAKAGRKRGRARRGVTSSFPRRYFRAAHRFRESVKRPRGSIHSDLGRTGATAREAESQLHLRNQRKSPKTICPIFRWRPLLVSGIPIRRDSRALAADRPIARLQEKPPKPIEPASVYLCASSCPHASVPNFRSQVDGEPASTEPVRRTAVSAGPRSDDRESVRRLRHCAAAPIR